VVISTLKNTAPHTCFVLSSQNRFGLVFENRRSPRIGPIFGQGSRVNASHERKQLT
jgi:hypothetical protein